MLKNLFKQKTDKPKEYPALLAGLEVAIEVNGHKFYTFPSLDSTPKIREMMLRIYYKQVSFGITREDDDACDEILREAVNKQDLVTMASVLEAKKYMKENYASAKVLTQLAGPVIIVDDEPLKEGTDKHNQIKREQLERSKELRAFFLNTAMRQLNALGMNLNISETESKLMNPERIRRENHFLYLIRSGMHKNLWMYQY